MNFSANLAAKRSAAGLTQAELAKAAKLHPISLARYESGTRQPDARQAVALARALGETVDRLAGQRPPRGQIGAAKSIKALRQSLDLTDTAVAAAAGLSVHYYRNVEAGRRGLSLDGLMKLSGALRVPADDLAALI